MGDFVRPEVVRLSLSGGRWLDVKKRLNAGESRKMFARVVSDMSSVGGQMVRKFDPEQVGLTSLVSYIVGWSLTDDDGKPVRYSVAALDSVDPDLYAEMIKTVETHMEAQEQARSAEKNDSPDGASSSSVISPSPSDAAGVLTGSVS